MIGVGDFLKSHREQKGIRLEEIASITKIHIHHLQLIERESWKDLPPEPFIRGFLTAYAKYVGADPREALTKFYEGRGITPVEAETVPPLTAPHSPRTSAAVNPSRLIEQAEPFPLAKAMIGLGAVAFVVLVGALITIGKKASVADTTTATAESPLSVAAAVPNEDAPKVNEPIAASSAPVPPVVSAPVVAVSAPVVAKVEPTAPPAVEKPKPVAAKKGEAVAKAEPAAGMPSGDFKHVLTVETSKKTWIKIVADGQPPKQTISKDNDKLTFSAKEKIKLVLGNPTGVKVSHNGTEAEGTKSGSVHYYRFPTNAKFPQDQPKPRAVSSDADNAATSKEGATAKAPKTIGDWLDSPSPESRTQ